MRKLLLTTISFTILFFSCNSDKNTEIIEAESEETLKRKALTNEAFITKVGNAFNRTIQNTNVWEAIKTTVAEDDLMMKQINSNLTIKDIVLPFLTIRDDIFLTNANNLFDITIIDDVLRSETTFEGILTRNYNELYPEDNISTGLIKNRLLKLHIGFPKIAIENYTEWKTNNFPIYLQAYDAAENNLKLASKKEIIQKVGKENYYKLVSTNKEENEFYYFIENKLETIVIASKKENRKKNTVLMTVKEDNVNFISFDINDNKTHNTITINSNEVTYTVPQANMQYQTTINTYVPEPCSGFYVFELGSQALQNFLSQQQTRANADCETYGACLPLCDPNSGYVSYYMFEFKPTSKKCALAMNYIDTISLYSLAN